MSETKSPTLTFVKDGVYYFSRRIPSQLQSHYTSPRIAYSLRTRSPRIAVVRASRAADWLDEYWFHLRSRDTDLPGKHMLRLARDGVPTPTGETSLDSSSIPLSEAVHLYLRLKGKGRPVTFHRAAERSCGYVVDVIGDKSLDSYTKADANAFRDVLIARDLAGSSITRILGTVRSVINFAASERGLQLNNPFSGVYYDRSAGVADRNPVPSDAIQSVQSKCREIDDDLRWLVAMVSDTGMRLAEAAGLSRDDIQRDDQGILFARVGPHPWRRLKTNCSERDVPLERAARWAAERVLAQPSTSSFAFPRYNRDGTTNANAASTSLNKWLKPLVPSKPPTGKVIEEVRAAA